MRPGKVLVLCAAVMALLSCSKERAAKPSIETQITGKWRSSFVSDIVYVTATNTELVRYNYASGLGTLIDIDGKGTIVSTDYETQYTLTHDYVLHNDGMYDYINTQIIRTDPTDYQITGIDDDEMRVKGKVITDYNYRHSDGKSYNVYFLRTEIFKRQ